jgi:phospholipid/cholesterol/gamma-HCH transport system ATP-binding protein
MAGDAIISVRGIRNQFGRQVIHDGLDLDIHRGEVLGIVGGSGTGKSVLLRTILGLNRPVAGRVEVFGHVRGEMSAAEERAVERRWGVLFQDGALFSSLTVAQNVQVALREHLDMPQYLMDEIAAVKIALAGLPPEAGPKYPSELSGGMRKRAGLARALALDPEVLFLDEPTAGLDPIGAAAFDDLIADLQATLGLTVFMVTHDLDSLYAICDRIAVLAERRVLVTGTIDEMAAQAHPWIREYFHGPRGLVAVAARDRNAAGLNEKGEI